jgi:hypothetical protein
LTEPGSGYTVIGAGKTAMDACSWLLDSGVPADAIRWIRPRDAWIHDRTFQQPLTLVGQLIEGQARTLEAAAQAESVDMLFAGLEACGQLTRLDPTVEPTMYRCATSCPSELDRLRLIGNVVRRGRVTHIGVERIDLEEGSIPTDAGQVHVDCTAGGLRLSPGRPIFEADRITLQQVRSCQPTFNAALLGYIETSRNDDTEKNRLCPPNPYPTTAVDWIARIAISQHAQALWDKEPDLAAWMECSRLNAARGIRAHSANPEVRSAIHRLVANVGPATANLDRLLAQTASYSR